MNFVCQKEAMTKLEDLARSNRHSILIEGIEGSGKTYLSKQYSKFLDVEDFQIVDPTVQSIKDTISGCMQIDTPVVLCIENLDLGVMAASYALLKFLEEPANHVYIIITCRNANKVPDTILSRSTTVVTSPPLISDIEQFAISKNFDRFHQLEKSTVWRCVKTFRDAELVMSLTSDNLAYFDSLQETIKFRDSVSNIVWKLGHYDDNKEAPIELVIKYMVEIAPTQYIRKCGIDCIRDLSTSRLASHSVLTKYVLDCKYCE